MSNIKWTHELVHKEALKYSSHTDFKNGSGGAYCYARRNNIIDEVCKHMENECGVIGCTKLTKRSYCEEHTKQFTKSQDNESIEIIIDMAHKNDSNGMLPNEWDY